MRQTRFHDLVAKEAIGKGTAEFAQHVRQPEQLDEWQQAVIELKRDVEQQLTDRKVGMDSRHAECVDMGDVGKRIYFRERAEWQSWRRGSTRFKSALEDRLGEIKRLRRASASDRAVLIQLLRQARALVPTVCVDWHREVGEVLDT